MGTMGRRKQLAIGDPNVSIRELVIKHGLDPVDELLKMVKETLPWPDDEFLKKNPSWLAALYDKGYEPFLIDGVRRLRMGQGRKADILCKLAPFMYPTLKSSESREQKDYNFNITINDRRGSTKAIDVQAERLLPDTVEVKPE